MGPPRESCTPGMQTATYGIVILSSGFFAREWCMKELQTFLDQEKIIHVFYGGFEEVQEAKRAAIEERVWTTFKSYLRTEDLSTAGWLRLTPSTTRCGWRRRGDGGVSVSRRSGMRSVPRLLGQDNLGGITILEDELLAGRAQHLIELKSSWGCHRTAWAAAGRYNRTMRSWNRGPMGGVGKSTLARRCTTCQMCESGGDGGLCWLEAGRNARDDKVRDLQKQILELLSNTDEDPRNLARGRELIRQRLEGRRVLICLNNV